MKWDFDIYTCGVKPITMVQRKRFATTQHAEAFLILIFLTNNGSTRSLKFQLKDTQGYIENN